MSRPRPPPAPVTAADRPEFFDANDMTSSFGSIARETVWSAGLVGGDRPIGTEPSVVRHEGYRSTIRRASLIIRLSLSLKVERRNAVVDLDDLGTFVEVADAGGVTAAARRLGVSKSIVSRRLARLEAELGVQLLARTTRGAALTEAGVTFRDHAARACAEIDLARETILPAGDLRGRLRIAAPLSFGPTHLAPVLAQLARRHPRLHVHASYSDRFVDLIGEGFDCAIRVGQLSDSNLIARRIGPIHGKLVASPVYVREHGAPETPDQLLAHQCLM